MFKTVAFKIEAEFWRQRLRQYPVLMLCLILLAFLGVLAWGFFPGYGMEAADAATAVDAAAGSESTLIRWHFYAASDSEGDQLLKIAVKEAVMAEAEQLFSEAETMTDCRRLLAANLPRLYETACRTLAAEEAALAGEGSGDGSGPMPDNCRQIQVYYEPRYFSSRQLTEGSLPAGVYETVAFVLGEGEGSNWWCLLYPPLSPGQKVVFASVPQSRITQKAQQKYDGKYDRLPVQCKLKIWEILSREK